MNSARPLSRRASFELTFFFSSAFSASSFSFYASAPNHTPTFLRFSRSSFHLAKVSGVTGFLAASPRGGFSHFLACGRWNAGKTLEMAASCPSLPDFRSRSVA